METIIDITNRCKIERALGIMEGVSAGMENDIRREMLYAALGMIEEAIEIKDGERKE